MARRQGGWLGVLMAPTLVALNLLAISAPATARDATPLRLARGARVGVITLLDAEVTHFHAAKAIKDTALHTEPVAWSVPNMLIDALKDRAFQMGLVLVPLAVTDELDRARESCFLNGHFEKKLPKDCIAAFEHLGVAERVDAVIALAPGLNNSTHAGSTRRKEMQDYVRGWGVETGDNDSPDGKPVLFSMTELLLVAPSPDGPVLRAREWGGNYTLEWSNYVEPADPKTLPANSYPQLQPLFAAILSRQTARLLEQIEVGP
jgi:hypothetical protein